MDLVNTSEKNKENYRAYNNSKCYFKRPILFSVNQILQIYLISNCSGVGGTLFDLVIGSLTATESCEWTTLFQSKDRKDNIGKYTFTHI